MLTSIGFNPYMQTCNAFDHAFPVKAKGWGIVSWDCDLIYDDSDRTSCIHIRRLARMTPYGSTETVREGVDVSLYLNKPDASRDELETALLRACREFVPGHWTKSPWAGFHDDRVFPGDRYTILWG